LKSEIITLEKNNKEYKNKNKNLESNINKFNKEIENIKNKQDEIADLKLKIFNLEKEKNLLQKEIEAIRMNESNNNKINQIIIDVNNLKSELDNNNKKSNKKRESSQKQNKKEHEDLYDKINNLVKQIKELKDEHEKLNYKIEENNKNKMDIEESIDNNLNLRENGLNLEKLSGDNEFNNNFLNQTIINICFKFIDGKILGSIPSGPMGRLKDLFISALKKNFDYQEVDINSFKFFYNAKNVTNYFIRNDKLTSLGINTNCTINVDLS